jgi:hypothetical protein
VGKRAFEARLNGKHVAPLIKHYLREAGISHRSCLAWFYEETLRWGLFQQPVLMIAVKPLFHCK